MLCAGTLPRTGFRQRVEAAKEAGFKAISLFPQQYLRARKKEKLSPGDMRTILSDNGIELREVDPLLDWFGPGVSPEETLIFEIAAELGASSINTPTAFAPAIGLEGVTNALANLGKRAARHGLQIDLEYLPWTIVPDLKSALQVVGDTGMENIGVTLDFWHFFRSGDSVDTLLNLSPPEAALITNLQINDAPSNPQPLSLRNKLALMLVMLNNLRDGIRISGTKQFFATVSGAKATRKDATALMNEATSNRLLPGDGDMPLKDWLAALDGAGCKPRAGLEIFSLDLARLPAEEVAAKSMAAYGRITSG